MKNQSGATLVIALSLLAIITLSVVYSLESSNIQSRMVANSVYSLRTYQATSNELSAFIRNLEENDQDRANLLSNLSAVGAVINPSPETSPVGVALGNEVIFTGKYKKGGHGGEVSTDTPAEFPVYELTSRGEFSSAISNQSIGFGIQKLKIVGLYSN